jgi:hypothetical protein
MHIPEVDVLRNLALEHLVHTRHQLQEVLDGQPATRKLLDKAKRGPEHSLLLRIDTSQEDIQVLVIECLKKVFDGGLRTGRGRASHTHEGINRKQKSANN